MRVYYDNHGQFSGYSRHVGFPAIGCLLACLVAFVFVVSYPVLWPLYTFGFTLLGWVTESAWALLCLTLLALLGRHTRNRAELRRNTHPAGRHAAPGNWTPQVLPWDDGTRSL